jgi:hypothetical protein
MGSAMNIPQLLIIVGLVALIFGSKRFTAMADGVRSQLHKELGRMPVYSAETTGGKEAELIRDRLPKRFPRFVAVAIVILGAVAWWLTR